MTLRRDLPCGTVFRYLKAGETGGIIQVGYSAVAVYITSPPCTEDPCPVDVPHPPNPWAGIPAAWSNADLDAEVVIVETVP